VAAAAHDRLIRVNAGEALHAYDPMSVVWRAPAPRWRQNPPLGVIRPCEPSLVDRPPAGPGWLHEVKHDGFRILARKQGERVHIWSRHGADFTYRFPAIAEAVRGLAADRALIDGEAVVLRNDGRSDFLALLTKWVGARATLVAFDLVRLNGDDQRLRPLEARQRLVVGVDGILFSEALAAEGAIVFAKACELGLEGIVSKRPGSFYRCGRSRNWVKTKNPDFVRT
jgi:bifunctional non-homologous end joining protein LigD